MVGVWAQHRVKLLFELASFHLTADLLATAGLALRVFRLRRFSKPRQNPYKLHGFSFKPDDITLWLKRLSADIQELLRFAHLQLQVEFS